MRTHIKEMDQNRLAESGIWYFWRYCIIESPNNADNFFYGWYSFQYTAFEKNWIDLGESYYNKSDWFSFLVDLVEEKIRLHKTQKTTISRQVTKATDIPKSSHEAGRRLTGNALIEKTKECGKLGLSTREICIACCYYKQNENSNKQPLRNSFYKALLAAKKESSTDNT